MKKKIPTSFSVEFTDEVQPLTATLSLCRARIFYKGLNRNGSYITDEFADKLIQTLPYAPVKGIYDGETADYGGHRYDSPRGQIYGVVPGQDKINFAWQEHLDKDGVLRNYATCNVILYTAIFEEASKIPEKAQSMELFGPSIKGEWSTDFSGQEAFVFTDGCFLGLQILGDEVEPCFEGASFYSLEELTNQFSKLIEQINCFEQKIIEQEGELEMPFKYAIPAEQEELFNNVWGKLNTNFSEEQGYLVDNDIISISEDYVVFHNVTDNQFYTVSIGSDDENNLTLGEPATSGYIQMTENFSKLLTENENLDSLAEKFSDNLIKIGEYEETISTLNTEKEQLQSALTEQQTAYATLEKEVEQLKTYRQQIETAEKEAVIGKYANKLSDEVIDSFKNNIAQYDKNSLERELAFAFVQANEALLKTETDVLEPKPQQYSSIELILNQYENKN